MVLFKLSHVTVAAAAVLLAGGAGFVAHDGFATVRIVEKGPDGVALILPVPVAAGHLALGLLPEEELREARRDLQALGPVLSALAEELAGAPDALLVEVVDGDERLLIAKRGRKLVIEVTTPREEVRVKLPLGSVDCLMGSLLDRAEV